MSQAEPNPFQAPLVDSTPERKQEPPATEKDGLLQIAKRTFLHWEKLRMIYIAACGLVTVGSLLVLGIENITIDEYAALAFCAVFANVCFFAAPVIDTYCTWLGLKTKALRIMLLAAGILFTCVAAVMVVSDVVNN